jgi:hypothetical protein
MLIDILACTSTLFVADPAFGYLRGFDATTGAIEICDPLVFDSVAALATGGSTLYFGGVFATRRTGRWDYLGAAEPAACRRSFMPLAQR